MSGAVAVIGSANADLVVEVERRPLGGETILGSDLVTSPGGKGANQAAAAGRAGGEVTFVGCVGADASGDLLVDSLTRAGVATDALRRVDAPTGNALIVVTPDGENSIIVSPGANAHVTPALVDDAADAWRGAAVVVLQLEIPLETVRHVAVAASGAGSRVMVNLAPAASVPAEVIAAADPLVVNESEAAFLLGVEPDALPADPGAVVRALFGLGARSVVVTLGAAGAWVAEESRDAVHVPALKVTPVDTTGAGDGFVGAMAARLAAGDSLVAAARVATRFAGLAVQRRGAQDSYPSPGELAGEAAD
ncbi:MAG: ribokinase [Propionibacteriaceae bacterium]|nr:ribokinase [Propionibacteriaceae bacterium]